MTASYTTTRGTTLPGVRNVRPGRWLQEVDALSLAEHRFEVLHCPGHSPGHVVYLSRDRRLGLVGDVLFQGPIGRTDFPYGDSGALFDSPRHKLLPLGDEMEFLCGHGPGSTIGAERLSNPFVRQSIAARSSRNLTGAQAKLAQPLRCDAFHGRDKPTSNVEPVFTF